MAQWWMPVLAAPFVGSTLGVVVRRLPAGQPVAVTRSACEACGHALGPAELVPIVSYLALRGQCRHCGTSIATMHLAIELAALAVAAVAACVVSGDALWAGCLLGWTLLALAWIDQATFWLPDVLTLPLVILGLAVTWWLQSWALEDHALAAAVGYASLRGVAWGYRRLRRREGLGEGDAKLFAASGAWLGVSSLPSVLIGAAAAGLFWVGVSALRGRSVGAATAVPFGPCLAAATWLVWLYSSPDL